MARGFRRLVVLGAGTMGSQLAAHAVARGLEVALLDLVPSGAGDRSRLARKAIDGLRRWKPSPLHLAEHAAAIHPGNLEDDLWALESADWILEAVVEDLAAKRELFARVAAFAGERAVLTSNTSGLSIAEMSASLPPALRRRFLGTHFFNPPRYLKLLETIPGPETDHAVLARVEDFCDRVLGKAVVRCKDTPSFIANRIGSYGFASALRAMMDLELTVEEVDALTGPLIGRARSATFRTADIAGVDVCARVAANLHAAVTEDPERELFRVPDFMRSMVERGWLGEKAGAGFYRREGKALRVLDWRRLEHREQQPPRLAALEAAQRLRDPGARIASLLAGDDASARFLWRVVVGTCLYAADRVPEISDDIAAVDRAMEWGYGWGLPPFRLLDALGVAEVAARAAADGRPLPPLVERLLASGRRRFYEGDGGAETAFGPRGVVVVPERTGVVQVAALRARGALVKATPAASLLDLGDGCALLEFHSKMNTLSDDSFGLLAESARLAPGRFEALVIGNQGEHFTAGADLARALAGAAEGRWDEIERSIRLFQDANMALKCAEIPVVAAPFGLSLGGGCEIALHATRVRCSAETYLGLVEAGVGLIPGGGGTKEMALRAALRCAGVPDADAFPFLKQAFETIAFARVSGSGAEALRLYLSPADSLSPNPDRLIADAKEIALGLARAGHAPARPREDLPALGRPALAAFRMGIHNALRAGQVSEHDALVAGKVASVLCGGDRVPGLASERDFLDLEREAFLSLLGTPKTQARIRHTLETGKPLRN